MNKENIEKIKAAATARLDMAETPEEIEKANDEIKAIEALEKDFIETEENNASLLKSYKESLRGEPFKKDPNQDQEEEENGGNGLEFDEALAKVLSQRNK